MTTVSQRGFSLLAIIQIMWEYPPSEPPIGRYIWFMRILQTKKHSQCLLGISLFFIFFSPLFSSFFLLVFLFCATPPPAYLWCSFPRLPLIIHWCFAKWGSKTLSVSISRSIKYNLLWFNFFLMRAMGAERCITLAAARGDAVEKPPCTQVAAKHGQFILLSSTAACQAADPYLELFLCVWSGAWVRSCVSPEEEVSEGDHHGCNKPTQ